MDARAITQLLPVLVLGAAAACGGPPGAGGAAGIADAGSERMTDPDAQRPEACDTYDDDGDGRVDEDCACTTGETQPCHPWTSSAEPACPHVGVQACDGGGEFGGVWGDCVVEAPDESELCPWWILGEAGGDHFGLGEVGFGDLNGDGSLDVVGTALDATSTATSDTGVAYALFGGGSRVGTVTDLALEPLAGDDGFRVGGIGMWFAAYTHATTIDARIADLDGDGFGDLVTTTRGRALFTVFGGPDALPTYTPAMAGGPRVTLLEGAAGSHGVSGLLGADVDGDGRAEVLSAGNNWDAAGSTREGVSLWEGRETFSGVTPRDRMIEIGVEAIGQSSLGNNSSLGAVGDFDADGYLDVTAVNGASNDTILRTYYSFIYYGGPGGIAVTNMRSYEDGQGTSITGGPGRGTIPAHQYGDFDGDGIDDLLVSGAGDGYAPRGIFLLYGRRGERPGNLDVSGELAPDAGLALVTDPEHPIAGLAAGGFGDIDGDGRDDLVLSAGSETMSEIVIVWGRSGRTGAALDLGTDAGVTRLALGPLAVEAGLDPEGLGGAAMAVAVADVDGDGLGDVVVGLRLADTPNGEESGASVVVFGRELYAYHNPALHRTSGGADEVDASGGVVTASTGRGRDHISGIGADDVVLGGEGDDTFLLVDTSFARIDGGYGEDTVALMTPGLMLDLREMGRRRLSEVERFDLRADGAQSVALNAGDASALSSTSRTIHVEGTPEDRLILEGAWVLEGGGYRVGALVVSVAGGVSVDIRPGA